MVAGNPPSAPAATPNVSRALIVAIGASAIQLLMMIPGYSEDGSFQVGEWLVVLAISLVLSVALFLFAVPRGGVTAGIVLGALAVASVLVFWAGITLPLAAASAAMGWRFRRDGNTAAGPVVVLSLAVLATVGLVAIIISDAVAN
jgi:hypothetical protein